MPVEDFLDVRNRMVRDFTQRQKKYHAKQHEYDIQKTGIEGDINLALQNLRNRGALNLQREQNQFEAPLQAARVSDINQDTKGKAFDLRLGMDYTGSFLEQKRKQGKYTDEYFRSLLGEESSGEPSGLIPYLNSRSIAPLSQKELPFNVMNYHPFVLAYRAAKKTQSLRKSIPDFLKRHFRLPDFNE